MKLADVYNFLEVLRDYDGTPGSIRALSKYGINRASDRFWAVYDRLQDRFLEQYPVEAGLFDLNRYYHQTFKPEELEEK